MAVLLAFLISPIGRIIGLIVACSLLLSAVGVKLYHDGVVHERDKWVAAEQAAITQGAKARADAVRSVSRSPKSRWLRHHDRYDRD